MARLAHELDIHDTSTDNTDYLLISASEFVNNYLTSLGTVGSKFEKSLKEHDELIKNTSADKFDRALTELGKMLGFDAEKPDGTGAPDSVWRLSNDYVLLFESKSDESSSDGISISTCRQAQGHLNWQKSRPFFSQHATMLSIVISPRTFLDKDALPHAGDLYYQNIENIRKLFTETGNCLRTIRSKSPDLEPEQRISLIQSEFNNSNLCPVKIIERLTKNKIVNLEKK